MTNEKKLTHIDLFSGIGGFTLAGEWAGFKTISFCEKEEFCQKVLKKHWPEIPIIEEIRDFDGTKWRDATLLTGGFPCQPFSIAGPRTGKEDDRYLWPEMLRIIKEARPRWILAENVTGIVKLALGEVLSDLESIGYDFPRDHEGTPIVPVIPACGLNAPHRRHRVWIIANSRCQHGKGTKNKGKPRRPLFEKKDASLPKRPVENDEFGDAQDTIGTRIGNQDGKAGDKKGRIGQDRRASIRQEDRTIGASRITATNKDASDSEGKQDDARKKRDVGGAEKTGRSINPAVVFGNQYAPNPEGTECMWSERTWGGGERFTDNDWQEDWYEVATRFCRVDDGFPSWVHGDRVKRLKALGNAIVPQIAYEILKNIAWIENEKVAD